MVTGADTRRQGSTRKSLAGYGITVLGLVVGGVAGGWAGFGAGAWLGDRFVRLAELQWTPALLGLVAGASAGAALIVGFSLRVFGLGPAGLTAVVLGALVPPIFGAPLLWGPDIETSQLLVTLIGATLLMPVLSRATATRIARTGSASTGRNVAAIVWILELAIWTVWSLSASRHPGI